jgi:hypothetical protein
MWPKLPTFWRYKLPPSSGSKCMRWVYTTLFRNITGGGKVCICRLPLSVRGRLNVEITQLKNYSVIKMTHLTQSEQWYSCHLYAPNPLGTATINYFAYSGQNVKLTVDLHPGLSSGMHVLKIRLLDSVPCHSPVCMVLSPSAGTAETRPAVSLLFLDPVMGIGGCGNVSFSPWLKRV